MAKNYSPKKIQIVFEQVETTSEEVEKRLSEAYAILFEETMKYLKEKKAMKKNNSQFDNQTQKGGEQYERRYAN